MTRVLETVLTARNLLSPELAKASKDVVAYNAQVAGAQEKAAAGATTSAARQEAAAAKVAASSAKASTAAASGAAVQSKAATDVGQANTRAAESATASANVQSRAHAKAAESATLSARAQQSANRALAASNGLLGTSLTPLTAGLGALGLGLGYAAYRGMNFDAAMSQVQAATMATAGTMDRLRDAAIDQGAKTKYSSEEAAQGITEMAKAGVSTADILDGGLAGALNLAAAGQIAVGDAAEIAATQLTVFGLKGDQVNHVADLLAAGAGKAQGSVQDMALALQYAGLPAKGLSMSIEETTGALGLFAANGLVGEKAGTSFRGMLTSLTNPAAKTVTLMDDLNLSFFDAQGNFIGMSGVAQQLHDKLGPLSEETRNQALAQIFGNEALGAAQILYKSGAPGVEQWTKNVNDAGYAAKQAAINQDNLKGDLEKLGGAFDSTMTTIGSGVQGPLREIVQAFTAIVNAGGDIIGFWQSLPGPVQVALVALGGVAALKGPVGDALTWISLQAMNIPGALERAGGAMGGLKAAGSGLLGFFGGPWGLAITGATVGLSLLVSWLGKSDDTTSQLASSQRTLTDAIAATNGVIDESVRRTAAKVLQDQHLLQFTDLYGVSSKDMVGYVLGEADAHDRVSAAVQRYRASLESKLTGDKDADAVTRGLIGAVDTHIAALDGLAAGTDTQIGKERQLAEATGLTAAAVTGSAAAADGAYDSLSGYAAALGLDEQATKDLIDASNGLGASLANFVDPLSTYTGLLQQKAQAEADAANATAEKTGAASKSWEDFKNLVHVTFDEYMADLEAQVTAQADWQTNMLLLAGRVSAGTLAELSKMGPEGAPLVADLVNRSDAELDRFDEVTALRSQQAMNSWGATLTMAQPVLTAIAGKAGQGVADEVARKLAAGTTTIAAEAAKYGVVIANGINPVLKALGVPAVHGEAQSSGGYAAGGYTGDGPKYAPAGLVHRGEYVVTKERTAKLGVRTLENIEKILPGYADGGFVTAADVPRPPSTAPFAPPISSAADGAMGKEYHEATTWLTKTMGAMGGPAGAGVQRWLPLVLASLNLVGQPAGLAQTVLRRMQQESGGNPRAINLTDINARRGTPSKGLMQVIDPTFRAYAMAGHNRDIWDPLSNILASERYAMARYGSLSAAYNKAGGYDSGGLATDAGYLPKQTVLPERVLSPRQTEAFERWMSIAPAAMPGYGMGGWGAAAAGGRVNVAAPNVTVQVLIDGQEFKGMAKVVVDGRLEDLYRQQVRR